MKRTKTSTFFQVFSKLFGGNAGGFPTAAVNQVKGGQSEGVVVSAFVNASIIEEDQMYSYEVSLSEGSQLS